jgi:hypothetical protein
VDTARICQFSATQRYWPPPKPFAAQAIRDVLGVGAIAEYLDASLTILAEYETT